jgi:hypothetical protein
MRNKAGKGQPAAKGQIFYIRKWCRIHGFDPAASKPKPKRIDRNQHALRRPNSG